MLTPFSADSIRQQIQTALLQPDAVPAGHGGALVLAADTEGARFFGAQKIGSHWQVQELADHPWNGDDKIGLTVKASW